MRSNSHTTTDGKREPHADKKTRTAPVFQNLTGAAFIIRASMEEREKKEYSFGIPHPMDHTLLGVVNRYKQNSRTEQNTVGDTQKPLVSLLLLNTPNAKVDSLRLTVDFPPGKGFTFVLFA